MNTRDINIGVPTDPLGGYNAWAAGTWAEHKDLLPKCGDSRERVLLLAAEAAESGLRETCAER